MQIRMFEVFCTHLARRVWYVQVLRNKKREKKKKKSHHPYISPPRRSAATAPRWTKLGSIGEWPNVITPYHFQVYCFKAVGLAGGGR